MSQGNHLKRIIVIGASGNVGASTLRHLLRTNTNISITAVTRLDSSASFPASPQLQVKKGAYSDASFLASVFEGQDLALFALNFMAMDVQPALIEAAAKAGIKWIIPTEYAGDGMNQGLFEAVPMFHGKTAARRQIEDLAKTHNGLKWIGVATNPWLEFSIRMGTFDINAKDRSATLYSGTGSFNTSSADRVGLGIARLLSLPLTSSTNPRASLEHYANRFVYLSSLSTTQEGIFESVQRATGTSDTDWTIERSSIKERIEDSKAKLAGGNMMAGAGLTYAYYMGEGLGGDYQDKAKEDLKVLGLEEEKLDEVVCRAIGDL